jgi:hypothetical protein
MSEKCYCNPVRVPDKSGKGLSCCEERLGRTCPVQEPDMCGKRYWNLATDPDKSGELRKTGWPGHVWFCLLESG